MWFLMSRAASRSASNSGSFATTARRRSTMPVSMPCSADCSCGSASASLAFCLERRRGEMLGEGHQRSPMAACRHAGQHLGDVARAHRLAEPLQLAAMFIRQPRSPEWCSAGSGGRRRGKVCATARAGR